MPIHCSEIFRKYISMLTPAEVNTQWLNLKHLFNFFLSCSSVLRFLNDIDFYEIL